MRERSPMPALFSRHIDYCFPSADLLERIERIAQPSPSWYPYSFQRLSAGKALFINRQSSRVFFHGSSLLTYRARVYLEIAPTPGGCRATLRPRNFEWLFPLFAGTLWFLLITAWMLLHPQTPQSILLLMAIFGGMFFVFAVIGLMFSRLLSRRVEWAMTALAGEMNTPS